MEVKLSFKTIFSKVLFFDLSLIGINSNDILIREIPINAFTPKELNSLANTSGVMIDPFGGDKHYLRIYVNKAYCQVEFMPTNEDRIKYLTNEIDKLSTELNSLV